MGLEVAKEVKPHLWQHLSGVYKSIVITNETGYQFTQKTPLTEIEVCFRAYHYNGTLEEFIDLFRTCERLLNVTEHTNNSRNTN